MSREPNSTRDRILETTVRLLEQKGGRGVRMSDIATHSRVSRQALYLHFASRAELLIAATRYLDEQLDLGKRLHGSRNAASGVSRLELFIQFWGHYIPDIYAIVKALMLAEASDEAAAAAWKDRCNAVREGCQAAIEALVADGMLADGWQPQQATDALWTQLHITNWENLTLHCGWSTEQYVERMTAMARSCFVRQT
uniref:TetR/AcrR family transcriptional regulator n=1 Tax=Marinobacterium profundum TaxID=1714300 RepID=UPI00082E7532|nr:TetR/AcrR family transcriptional regulator [Marinobacterium profundum]